MSKPIKIAPELSLPIDLVTQSIAILAKRGSGKSYCASVMAEEFLKSGQQIVVIDPTGAWWGLQSSADGKDEGFAVVVFGGDHGNVPLEESAGEVIATAIIEKGFSAIIDLSLFRKGQANRFVGIFLETMYRLNRDPIHLFVDESDAFAPQRVMGEDARTTGAMEDIVRRGRKRGIGCTLITQRPAVINKNVLTQCEMLIALRLVHPKDINAIMEWVNVHADEKQAQKMIDSLPSLPIGTAWIWSPGWGDIFKRIEIRKRETFDSGATPKPGEKIREPKKLAQIDIELLGKSIQETVERKKADDPSLLKKKIKELESLVDKKKDFIQEVDQTQINQLKERCEIEEKKSNYYAGQVSNAIEWFDKLSALLQKLPQLQLTLPENLNLPKWVKSVSVARTVAQPPPARRVSNGGTQTDTKVSGGLKRILTALAQVYPQSLTKRQIGIRSILSSSSGTFGTYMATLRSNGWITGTNEATITEEGLKALGDYEQLPTGKELFHYWMNELGSGGITRILEVAFNKYPNAIDRDELAERAEISPTSGTYGTYLAKLRTLQLIEGTKQIKASDSFFE